MNDVGWFLRNIRDGSRPLGSQTEHYWRWPVGLHLDLRWLFDRRRHDFLSAHGIRDGVIYGHGFPQPATRTFFWIGPVCIEVGWKRAAIERWRWQRQLRTEEQR